MLIGYALIALLASPSLPSVGDAIDAEILDGAQRARITALPAPAPSTPELRALGKKLFFDPILSGNRDVSCSSCHDPALGTGDGRPLSLGSHGAPLSRHTPPLYNLGQASIRRLFWDGRVLQRANGFRTPELGLNGPSPALRAITAPMTSALAAQTLFPMISHEEMRGQPGTNEIADAPTSARAWELITARVIAAAGYGKAIADAFPESSGTSITIGHLGQAMAAFIGHEFDRRDTPWDRYLSGDLQALTPREKQGARVFVSAKARCVTCHSGPLLSDFDLHTVAFPQIGPGTTPTHSDLGGFAVKPVSEGVMFSFRTPPLRNVALTGPYTHSGALRTLREVVAHYTDQARSLREYRVDWVQAQYSTPIPHETADDAMRLSFLSQDVSTPPIQLEEPEIDDLVYFLERSLTDRGITTPSGSL